MYTRIISLIGAENFAKITKANCLLVGLGGVGATAAEALIRSGLKNLTLIDYDIIAESNLNRQIMTNIKNIGQKKTNVLLAKLKDINPDADIKIIDTFLNEDNMNLLGKYDYIIDACDTVKTKVLLIAYALKNNIKIISSMGTGKRLDPTKLKITTLNKTYNDPLAKKVRKEVKNKNLPLNIPVVFSEELPINTVNTIGSMMFVPSTAGLLIASYIIKNIINL